MVHCIFIDGKMAGYATVPYSSSDEKEIIISITETKLIELVGEDWREQYSNIKLEKDELVLVPSDDHDTN
jgi:hypothetical protein